MTKSSLRLGVNFVVTVTHSVSTLSVSVTEYWVRSDTAVTLIQNNAWLKNTPDF